MNNLHWHLTDDQGWRIEIKKYPLLTEIGSIRNNSYIGRNTQMEDTRYGGFYTQEDINTIKQQWKENPFFESDDNNIRQLTITECERLQTLPDDYTKYEVWKNEVRETPKIARYEAVGNGWTVDVISHILGYLK